MVQKYSLLVPVNFTPSLLVDGGRVMIYLLVVAKSGLIASCVSSVGSGVKHAQLRLIATAINNSNLDPCRACNSGLFSSCSFIAGEAMCSGYMSADKWHVQVPWSNSRTRMSRFIDSRWGLMFAYFLYDTPRDCYLHWRELNYLRASEFCTVLLSALSQYECWLKNAKYERSYFD